MTRSERLKSIASYAQRTAEDERIRDQLQQTALRLGQAYERASHQPKSDPVRDKKLYRLVRQAASSLRDAGVAAQCQEPPPKRRGSPNALFAEGRNAVQVQRWLDHHSAAFILATYVHLLDGDLGGRVRCIAPPRGTARTTGE